DLDVWKECRKLRIELRKIAKSLPPEEKFRLVDQLTRACRSITNNIAEGYGRFHYQENIQYLRQSRGSVCECIDDLYVCFDEEYIDIKLFTELYEQSQLCIRLINGYIKYLNNRKSGGNVK
nr:four helix bundle protein [Ignavibacteria bacterium]